MRETQIHCAIALPVLRAKLEMLDEHVTERPERAIREAVVVAVDVRVVEPDAVQRVLRIIRRNLHASRFVAHVAIRRPGSPRHPCAVGVAHRRIQCRHEPPGGCLISIPCGPRMCSYGSRFETRMNLQSFR